MLDRTSTSCVILGLGIVLALGCRGAEKTREVTAAAQPVLACTRAANTTGFADPETAFARYAQAINEARWCDAIDAFDPSARRKLVASTFKGLLLMAGLDNPNRAQYHERLAAFCARHSLDYGERGRLAVLTASILNKSDIDAELAALEQLATHSPENVYFELMTHMAAVNGDAMMKFEPGLSDLEVTEDRVKANARASHGRKMPVVFAQTSNGWFLSES